MKIEKNIWYGFETIRDKLDFLDKVYAIDEVKLIHSREKYEDSNYLKVVKRSRTASTLIYRTTLNPHFMGEPVIYMRSPQKSVQGVTAIMLQELKAEKQIKEKNMNQLVRDYFKQEKDKVEKEAKDLQLEYLKSIKNFAKVNDAYKKFIDAANAVKLVFTNPFQLTDVIKVTLTESEEREYYNIGQSGDKAKFELGKKESVILALLNSADTHAERVAILEKYNII